MNWNFCIDISEKKALDLCNGFMSVGDGYGFGNDSGIGYDHGNADGIGDGYVFGIGYHYVLRIPDAVNQDHGCGNGYGYARGDGRSQKEWK